MMAKNRKAEVDAAAKEIDFSKNKYQLELDTSLGKIVLDTLPEKAPGHVTNLLSLAKIGYYDGLIFHRVISGFMIQGGCPEGTGTGGPGYTIKAEFNDTTHEPGVLSIARTNDHNSSSASREFRTSTGSTRRSARPPTRPASKRSVRSGRCRPALRIVPEPRSRSIRRKCSRRRSRPGEAGFAQIDQTSFPGNPVRTTDHNDTENQELNHARTDAASRFDDSVVRHGDGIRPAPHDSARAI